MHASIFGDSDDEDQDTDNNQLTQSLMGAPSPFNPSNAFGPYEDDERG